MAVYDRTLTQELKKMAFRNHVDLIGIADPKVFDDIPIKDRPRTTYPWKAVIVYAVRFESVAELSQESWYGRMEKLLIHIDKKLREFLNEKGYKAHSFTTEIDFHFWSDELHKRPFGERSLARQRRWCGLYYKMHDAAVSAGLGRLAKNNRILITPQYGPNVHLSMMITDAPLEPDDPCDGDPCAGCNLCLEVCPTGALTTLTGRGRPDESKCKPWDCHFACLRVCYEKFLKQS